MKTIKKEIIELGLKYSLLTDYTSFIAIDSVVRNEGGNDTTVIQALPLPEGVTDMAVGGFAASANEMYFNNKGRNKGMEEYLLKAFSNPFTEELKLSLTIPEKYANSQKKLKVFNYLGQLVIEIDLSNYCEGHHLITIRPSDYPQITTGLHMVQLEKNGQEKAILKINYIEKKHI